MGQAVGEHFLWSAALNGDVEAGWIEISSGKYVFQALELREVGRGGHDLQSTPLDQPVGLEHHRLLSLSESNPAAASEEKAKIGTYQNSTTLSAVDLKPMG